MTTAESCQNDSGAAVNRAAVVPAPDLYVFFVTQRLPELFTAFGIYLALLEILLRLRPSAHLSRVSTMVPARHP